MPEQEATDRFVYTIPLSDLKDWLFDERQKVQPYTERWKTLADVAGWIQLHESAARASRPAGVR